MLNRLLNEMSLSARGSAIALMSLAFAGCVYAGPLAPGASEIREGAFPDWVSRFLRSAGGARQATELLPPTVRDSGAIYLLVADHRGIGIDAAKVAILPHTADMPKLPVEGWLPVDGFGVLAAHLSPGEYTVYVRDAHHWPARRTVQVRAAAIDTLLALMLSGAEP